MDDRLGPEYYEGGLQEGRIGKIPLDEPAVEDGPGVAGTQVVVDEDLMAQRPQRLDDMAADVAGASCDKYPHLENLPLFKGLSAGCLYSAGVMLGQDGDGKAMGL